MPILAQIAVKRPRFFGLVRGYTAETRAAATRALTHHGTRQASDAVQQAVRDTRVRRIMGNETDNSVVVTRADDSPPEPDEPSSPPAS